jgi:GABA(A) receptor-associated protein
MSSFKKTHTFLERSEEVKRILKKYPDKIPIICEPNLNQIKFINTPTINKIKFLVPDDFTIGQFICVIRYQFHIKPEMGLFIFINNYIPSGSEYLYTIYNRLRDLDGFLYITYSFENTFG